MKPRTILVFLLALTAGATAGHWGFEPLLRRVCVGVFPQIVAMSVDGLRLAHLSFTLSMALFGLAFPMAIRLARASSRKSSALAHAVRAMIAGSLCFVLAGLHYRHEMNKGWSYTREIFGFWGNTRISLALNPLTRMGLIAAAGVLAYGFGRLIFPKR